MVLVCGAVQYRRRASGRTTVIEQYMMSTPPLLWPFRSMSTLPPWLSMQHIHCYFTCGNLDMSLQHLHDQLRFPLNLIAHQPPKQKTPLNILAPPPMLSSQIGHIELGCSAPDTRNIHQQHHSTQATRLFTMATCRFVAPFVVALALGSLSTCSRLDILQRCAELS